MNARARFLIAVFATAFATAFSIRGWAAEPAHAARAADYEREERWAQEVVPSIVVGDAVYLATPARAKVLAILTMPPRAAAGGIVVVHGLGVHPDWGLIGGLRTGLADAGYVTLAVQMPVLAASATRDDYAVTLPEAAERIVRRRRLSSRQGHREDRDRFAQHGRVDGECVSRAQRGRCVGADRHVRRIRGAAEAAGARHRRGNRDPAGSRNRARARCRHCRRTRARASSRSPAPITTSSGSRRSSSPRSQRFSTVRSPASARSG